MPDRLARIKHAAEGNWLQLWLRYGMDAEHFEKPNRPCPLCGGRDRFTYFPKEEGGRWYCRGCGWGDGFDLLMRHTGKDFGTILKELEQYLGLPASTGRAPERRKAGKGWGFGGARRPSGRLDPKDLWTVAKAPALLPDHPGHRYFASRGLSEALADTKAVRFLETLPYWEDGREVGSFPAAVGAVTDEKGALTTLHRLWLSDEGTKAPVETPKKLLGPMEEGLIRLYPAKTKLALTEGVETAMAVRLLADLPVWAAVSAAGLEHVSLARLPKGLREVTIYGDNDRSFTGASAAYALAAKLVREADHAGRTLTVRVRIPRRCGYDWNDVLLARAQSPGEASDDRAPRSMRKVYEKG